MKPYLNNGCVIIFDELYNHINWMEGEYKDNELVGEVIKFIEKDKKRPICSPQN